MERFKKEDLKLLRLLNDSKNLDKKQKIDSIIEKIDNPEVRISALENIGFVGIYADIDQMKIFTEKFLSFPDTRKMLEEKYWKSLVNSAQEGTMLYEILGQNSNIRDKMFDNIEYLINYTGTKKVSNDFDIAKAIIEIEGGTLAFTKNLDLFLPYIHENVGELIAPCIKSPESSAIIKERFEQIKEKVQTCDFFTMVNGMENNPLFKEEYDKYSYFAKLYQIALDGITNKDSNLENSSFGLYTSSLDRTIKYIIGSNNSEYSARKRTLDMVFENLLKTQNLEEIKLIFEHISDGQEIQYIGTGATSVVFQAGDQILKLANDKFKYAIPYHPRIMMPNFRKKYDNLVCVESFDEGDNDVSNISDEDLLNIFKELERAGIFWADARKDNLVRLLKDNNIPDYIRSAEFNVFGFLEDEDYPTNNHQVLKKGEYVVSDLDLLFRIDDPNIKVGCIDNNVLKYMYESGKYKFLEGKMIPEREEFEYLTRMKLKDITSTNTVKENPDTEDEYSL